MRFGMRLHRETYVADVIPNPALLNRELQTLFSDLDQFQTIFADLADWNCGRGVSDKSIERDAHIDRKDVAFLQLVARRKPVQEKKDRGVHRPRLPVEDPDRADVNELVRHRRNVHDPIMPLGI